MNLVLTIAIGDDYGQISNLTTNNIKAYADKIGADFKCITEKAISKTTPHWEKFQIYHFLETYDRIIYLDSDLIIREDCPNLFDVVPDYKLGLFNEAPFTDRSKELMIDICKSYNVKLDSWNGNYYNTGVIVLSKFHRSLFKKPDMEISNFYEQSYLNMLIAKREIDIFEIDYKFNRMSVLDRFTGEERHASYIIHYAGFLYNTSINHLMTLIQNDLKKWEQDKSNYQYKKHIYISVSGGIGDQICAEPAIRFLRNFHYPDDDVIVATHNPTLFKHLAKNNVTVIQHGNAQLANDTPYFIAETLPGPDKIQWAIVSHLLCNSTDYSSIATMKRILPLKDKQITFEVEQKDELSMLEKIHHISEDVDFDKMVLVHPGRHWDSKTFPVEYWQEIIDGLDKKGLKVCIVGKDEKGDPPFYIAGARGTVNVVARNNMIDLRNMLTIDELAALISKVKVLVSNDSFPIHLAGAFDNWIVLIPSCKHPDHVLPYRNGTIFYKTKSLYKKLVIDEIESKPTQLAQTSAEFRIQDWSEYLLNTETIVKEVYGIYS